MSTRTISSVQLARFAVDLATIAAIAIVLASLYCILKIDPPSDLHLLFPPLGQFTFRYWSPTYFPWTDVADNIYLGFALAHGWPIIEAGADNHMPGVPQLLGGWLWLFGFGQAAPSPQVAASAYLAACLVTLLFQTACLYSLLRVMFFPPAPAALIALAVCAYTAFLYDFAMPMSETLITYLLVFVPVLAARMLLAESATERLVAAVILGGPLTFGCLLLGLTVAPTNAMIAFVSLTALVWELWNEPRNWRVLLRDHRCWAAYACVAALVAVTFATVRTGDLYFWAVESNYSRGISPANKLAESFAAHVAAFLRGEGPIGARYPALLMALFCYFFVMIFVVPRQSGRVGSKSRLALFGALIVVAAVLTQWRSNSSFHSVPLLGLTIGVVLLSAGHLSPRWSVARSSLWLIPLWLLALGQIMFLRASIARVNEPTPRAAAFEIANVCHFGETVNCRCMQVSVFGPQLFLINDMHPCPNRPLTFNGPGANPTVSRWIVEDAKNPNISFWVYDSDALMIENGVPAAVIRFWRTQARCVNINDKEALCFAG